MNSECKLTQAYTFAHFKYCKLSYKTAENLQVVIKGIGLEIADLFICLVAVFLVLSHKVDHYDSYNLLKFLHKIRLEILWDILQICLTFQEYYL